MSIKLLIIYAIMKIVYIIDDCICLAGWSVKVGHCKENIFFIS